MFIAIHFLNKIYKKMYFAKKSYIDYNLELLSLGCFNQSLIHQ